METFKKIENIISEWIQPMLDKKIEENVDGRLFMDYDGKVKEPTSVKILELDKPNKMRRKYDPKKYCVNYKQRSKI